MKKGKVFGKGQLVLALMVVALGAAVWLNMRFSSPKYLGEATYVGADKESSAVETSAKAQETDYFGSARDEREIALEQTKDEIEEILDNDVLTEEERQTALAKVDAFGKRIESAVNIETLLKSKGFEDAVAIVGDSTVDVVVKSKGLTTAQTLQIQDIITSQTGVDLGSIKIVSVEK